jgi:hypothetical protein
MKIKSWEARQLVETEYLKNTFIIRAVISIAIFVFILSMFCQIAIVSHKRDIFVLGMLSISIAVFAQIILMGFQMKRKGCLSLINEKVKDSDSYEIEVKDLSKHFLAFSENLF